MKKNGILFLLSLPLLITIFDFAIFDKLGGLLGPEKYLDLRGLLSFTKIALLIKLIIGIFTLGFSSYELYKNNFNLPKVLLIVFLLASVWLIFWCWFSVIWSGWSHLIWY
jgi:hypothetical protein